MLLLFGSDFDGTVAQTFAPSPNGIGVTEAYRLACQKIFGSGFELYEEIGPLDSRSPMEVIRALLPTSKNGSVLIGKARKFLDSNHESLQGFVPAGKGAGLNWSSEDPHSVITEILVRVRMQLFWDEIGARFPDGRVWPEPCAGFLQFYGALRTFASHCVLRGIRLEFGIVSSGHDRFIERCFDAWQVPRPELMVTDDLMRSPLCSHIPPERRIKPQTGSFEMLRGECRTKFGCEAASETYIGDSLRADGGLAKNLDIGFIWFNPDSQSIPSLADNVLPISDWRELMQALCPSTIDMVLKGVDFFRAVREVLGR